MAIVNNGTVNGLPQDRLPSGYTLPVVTTILDFHYRFDTIIGLTWATVITNNNPAVNMASIVTGTSTAITAILTADFLGSANVTAYSVINGLENSNDAKIPANLQVNASQGLNVFVTIYVKAV